MGTLTQRTKPSGMNVTVPLMALREQGMKAKEIANRVGLGRRTVQRWLTQGEYGETNYHHQHRSRFDAYEAYVMRRWDEGCHNIQQLWREIKAASDTPIPIGHCGLILNRFVAKSKPLSPKPLALTTFRPKRPCGSSSVISRIEMKRSERNWQPFVRQVRRLRPSTSWFRSFYRWFASCKENVLMPGSRQWQKARSRNCNVSPMACNRTKPLFSWG